MAIAQWKFIVTDIQGNVIGEVMNADQRQVVLPLKDTATASFNIRTNNTINASIYADFCNPQWDGLLKCYRNNTLCFCGPIIAGQEVGNNQDSTVEVSAADPFVRMNSRLLGIPTSNPGTVVPFQVGNSVTTYDMATIVQTILSTANTQGYTGLEWYLGSGSTGTLGAAGPYYLQPAGDAIKQLSVGVNSFEFRVLPVEPYSGGGFGFPQIGVLDVQLTLGTTRNQVVFEYGTGKANVQSYSNTVDRTNLMNNGLMEQPATSDYSDVIGYIDSTSVSTRGLYMGVVDNGGVQFDTYRNILLQQAVSLRKQGRQVLAFQPSPNNVYDPLNDYTVGDQVRVRIVSNNVFRFDALMRIWGIQFDIDKNGNETTTLQLTPP